MPAGRVQRHDAPLAATSEEDVDAPRAEDTSSGGEEEVAVWARAELPLSNDVQVEQATRAVWQVSGCSFQTQAARVLFRVVRNFRPSYAGTANKHRLLRSNPRRPPTPIFQALADGKNRQILRLSLPLIGATEMDDWPGGDRQRYKACGPMVDSLLRGNPAAKVRPSP